MWNLCKVNTKDFRMTPVLTPSPYFTWKSWSALLWFFETPTPLQVWRFHTINNPRPIVFIMAHQMCQKHFFQQFINQSLICIKTIIAFHSAYSNKEWKFCTNENIYKLWLKMEVTVRTSVKTELFHLKIQTFMSFLT